VSTTSEIVAVLVDLDSLRRREPDAIRRREAILATKDELIGRIRAEQARTPADQP